MKILSPTVCYLDDILESDEHIVARAARICYASNGTNDEVLYKNLLSDNHKSMFRHLSRYYKCPCDKITSSLLQMIIESPFVDVAIDHKIHMIYISTNEQYVMEHSQFRLELQDRQVDILTAHNDEGFFNTGLLRYSFLINTGIDITRELNRVSPNSIAEQSTRYVDFIKKTGICFKHCHWMTTLNLYKKLLVKVMCKIDELFYKISRSKYGLNLKPQDARWCLFLDTTSRVVYTYSVNEWKHIINLRYFGTTGKPHPDAKIIGEHLYNFFINEGYTINKPLNNKFV